MSALPWIAGAVIVGAVLLARRRRRVQPSTGCPSLRGGTFAGFTYSFSGMFMENTPVILLHGRGGSDRTFSQKIGLPGFYVRGPDRLAQGFAWTRANFADASFPSELEAVTTKLVPFVKAIGRCYGKPLITGHSQGGAVALLFALRYPELVRGAVAASGGLPRVLWQSFQVPVTVVHGTDDELVPHNGALDLADTTGAELVSVEGAGHELQGELLVVFKGEIGELT